MSEPRDVECVGGPSDGVCLTIDGTATEIVMVAQRLPSQVWDTQTAMEMVDLRKHRYYLSEDRHHLLHESIL